MSSDNPGPASGAGHEPTSPLPQVDYLGAPQEPAKKGRKGALVAAATVGVLAVAGAGAWGVSALLGGTGPGAAVAVPANALAYLALDLDPGTGQKVEAYRTLRKFPAIKEQLGSGDDLRRSIVEGLLRDAPCDTLTFEDDFDPWLGDRAAVAALPGKDEPTPVFVLQVTDEDKAREGVAAIADCEGEGEGESGEEPGVAFTDEYMVLAEDDTTAQGVVSDAEDGSLADDDGYQRWVDEAGGPGVLTAYVDAKAPEALFGSLMGGPEYDAQLAGRAPVRHDETPSPSPVPGESPGMEGDLPSDMPSDLPSDLPSDFPSELLTAVPSDDFGGSMDEPMLPGLGAGQLEKVFESFDGAAMVVRFDDGALEVETAVGSDGELPSSDGQDSGLAQLPDSTALALGFGVGDTFVQDLLDNVGRAMGEDEVDAMLEEAETATGLSLPEDLQTLMGDGMSLAVDSSIDWSTPQTDGSVPQVPVGARIVGDPERIQPVLEKVLSAVGADGDLVVEAGDGVVAVGPDPDYVATLAGSGSLGEQESFQAALPGLEDSAGGMFVDFDADGWLMRLVDDQAPDPETRANLEPLHSLGLTGSTDGDVAHAVVRLTTD